MRGQRFVSESGSNSGTFERVGATRSQAIWILVRNTIVRVRELESTRLSAGGTISASQLADRFTAALQSPEVKRKLVAQGVYPVGMCGADFAALLRKQYDEYGRIIREANIKAE
jgi:hypothetical protein